MGILIPLCTRRTTPGTADDTPALSHRSHDVLGPQYASMLAGLLNLVPRLDEMAARIEILHALLPVGSFKLDIDRRRAELLSEIDRAKGKAIHAVMSSLAQHNQINQGKDDEH